MKTSSTGMACAPAPRTGALARAGTLLASLLTLAGCAATGTPALDAQFGESSRTLRAQQLIDPAAPTRNAQTTAASDGRTLRDAMERHAETYRNPPPTNVINIGVGSNSAK